MRKLISIGCLLLLTSACFKMPLDRSLKLGKPVINFPIEKVPVRGVKIAVRTNRRGDDADVEGELLAAGDGLIWVFQNGKTVNVPERIVRDVELQDLFPSGAGALGAWTALGAASSVSHLVALIVTVPLWLAVGVPASVSAANSNDLTVRPVNFKMLYQWARYPQGMPATSIKTLPARAPDKLAEKKAPPPPAQPPAQPLPQQTPSVKKPVRLPAKRRPPTPAELCPPLPGGEPSCGAMVVEGERALWAIGRASAKGDGAAMRKLAAMRARERLARMLAPKATGKQLSASLTGAVIVDRWRNKEEGAYYAVVALPLSACGLDDETASRLFARYSRQKQKGDGVGSGGQNKRGTNKRGTE